MTPTYHLSHFTFIEIIKQPGMRSLLIMALLLPFLMLIPVSLFMFDLGKVFTDFCLGSCHVLFTVFVFFIAGSLISSDIDQRISHLFLTLPVSRKQYLTARFIGLCAALIVLALTLAASSLISGLLANAIWSQYLPIQQAWFTVIGILLLTLPYIAFTAALLLIACYASSSIETLVFLSLTFLLAWISPAVLAALTSSEIAAKTPDIIIAFAHTLQYVLPDIDSATLASLIAHQQPIQASHIIAYITEHLSYAALLFIAALGVFQRRDLQ